MLTVDMNIFDYLSLRSKRLVKAGTSDRTVIRKGSCFSRNTSQKTCSWSSLTDSLYSASRSRRGCIVNMTETSLKIFQGLFFRSCTITTLHD